METTNDGMVEQLKLARRPYIIIENKIRIKWMDYIFVMEVINYIHCKVKIYREKPWHIFIYSICRARNYKKKDL